jgi:putative pyruvate formate lyase activating enzyme
LSDDGSAYIRSQAQGLLKQRVAAAHERMRQCNLCPRQCGVNRLTGETGFCRTADQAWVASYAPHFGEEAPLVGRHGSGTIFFTHCNLGCGFCQNFGISHEGDGQPVTHAQLAAIMLRLQDMGCHNVNLVSPSHVVPQILAALEMAVTRGLHIPLVYNTGGYDDPGTLALLDGIVDIYMPDFKFWDPDSGRVYCGVSDYAEIARQALRVMHRQVGELITDADGIARRGMIIRHLVMPQGLAETRRILTFIADELSKDTYVNLMPQYRPCGQAEELPALARTLGAHEFQAAVAAARDVGLRRLD